MKNKFGLLFLLFLIFCHTLGFSAEEPPFSINPVEEPGTPGIEKDFLSEFLYMMFYLAIILTIFVGLSWYLKKMTYSRQQQVNLLSEIKILETRRISPKSQLHLIEIENIRILIGETSTGVTRLAQLSKVGDFKQEMEKQ